MEIAVAIILGILALAMLIFLGKALPPVEARDAGREAFRQAHGRYPTEADYEDPIA